MCGSGTSPRAGRPGQPAVADDAGDEARRATLALDAGGARQEDAGGGRQDGFRHDRTVASRPPVTRRSGGRHRGPGAGSRPVREAQRSNRTVASGGTDAARASSVVAAFQRSTRLATRATTT